MGEIIIETTSSESKDITTELVKHIVRLNAVDNKSDIDGGDGLIDGDSSSVVDDSDVPGASGWHSVQGAVNLSFSGNDCRFKADNVGEFDDNVFDWETGSLNGKLNIVGQ